MSSRYEYKLPYGLRKIDNIERLIHISEISPHESGLKCNCVCPHCGVKLQAKLPKTKKDYTARFAHHDSDTCSYAAETAIHMKAKEIIDAEKCIVLPEVRASYKDMEKLISEEVKIIFDRVELEYRIDNIIPDVVAYINDRPILIEIKITHGIDDIKLKKIKAIGISTIEIDLSDLNTNYDPEMLYKEVIKKTERKTWIYNVIEEEKIKELRQEYKIKSEKMRQRHEAELKAKEKKRIEKIQNIKMLTDVEYQERLRQRWENGFVDNPIWNRYSRYMKINKDNIPEHLNLEIPGDFVFGCDRRVWQTFIFQNFIHNKVNTFKDQTYPISVEWITKKVKDVFKTYLIYDLLYLRDLNEFKDIPDLTDVLYSYLKALEDYGYLSEIPKGHKYYSKFIILDPNNVYEVRLVPSEISEYDTIVAYLNSEDWDECKKYLTELLIKYNKLNHFEFSGALEVLFNIIVEKYKT